jgi:pimeloyl-ACP methyl ester carboxylesterase
MKHRRFRLAPRLALVVGALVSASAREAAVLAADAFTSDRIDVVVRGKGPDLILVPGLASHRDVWLPAADTLDDRYRVHLVQVKGFAGLPPGANAEGAVSAPVAEELARYIRSARLERPAVIGHSMGGTIGMMLAARHPQAIGRLMVVDMMPHMAEMFGPPNATPESLRAAADGFRAKIVADPPPGSPGMLEQMFVGMTRDEAAKVKLVQGVRDSHRPTVGNAFHELIVTDLRPELSRITVPFSVLYVLPANVPTPPGQFDAAMRKLYANAPKARLTRIDDSNHFIQIDQPARFVTEVDALMRQK